MKHPLSALLAVLAALLLAACASPPVTAPAKPAALPATPFVTPALVPEQHWLDDLFHDTPVAVGPGPGGTLRVEVPLKYSFDDGRPAVKPPLAAVLDKVAASLGRQRRAKLQMAAPSAERTEVLRTQMVARGVAAYRIERLPTRADGVELRLLLPPLGVERLEDEAPAVSGRR